MAVDVGKMTRKQNGMSNEIKRKKFMKNLKSNEKEIPTRFAGSLLGISKELTVEYSMADDAGNVFKRRKVHDSSTLSKEIGLISKRKESGTSSQGK